MVVSTSRYSRCSGLWAVCFVLFASSDGYLGSRFGGRFLRQSCSRQKYDLDGMSCASRMEFPLVSLLPLIP